MTNIPNNLGGNFFPFRVDRPFQKGIVVQESEQEKLLPCKENGRRLSSTVEPQ